VAIYKRLIIYYGSEIYLTI